jgi:hypothetical protein
VAPDEPLMAAGLDSLGAVELRGALEGRLGLRLPGTLVFDYPSPAAIAAFAASRLGASAESEAAEEASAARAVPQADAVISASPAARGAAGGQLTVAVLGFSHRCVWREGGSLARARAAVLSRITTANA